MIVYCISGANRGLGLEPAVCPTTRPAEGNVILPTVRTTTTNTMDLKTASLHNTHMLVCDVGSFDSTRTLVAEIARLPDGRKVDFMLNVAPGGSTSRRS